jgi:hypothetical protein
MQKNVYRYLLSTALRILSKRLLYGCAAALPIITSSRYFYPLLAAGFPSPSAQLFLRCVLEVRGGKG